MVIIAMMPLSLPETTPEQMILLSRKGKAATFILEQKDKTEQQLLAAVLDKSAPPFARLGCAMRLLKEHDSPKSREAALTVILVDIPAGVNDWESASDWKLEYPVAAILVTHKELMPDIIEGMLHGKFPDGLAIFMLYEYHLLGFEPVKVLASYDPAKLSGKELKQRGYWMSQLKLYDEDIKRR